MHLDLDKTVLCALALVHYGINSSYGGDGDNVAYATFEIGKVDGLVQTNLQGTDNLHISSHILNELAGRIGAGKVGEDEGVYILAMETSEGVLAVAEFLVQGDVYLHLAVNEA